MASKSDVFQRLVGLETEYALLIPAQPADRVAQPADRVTGTGPGPRPANRYSLFRELVAVLGTKIPCAPARNMKEGVFHAAGGAVWFETERPAVGGGLIEGSTPECQSPRQLLAWQRAQDELLAEAAAEAFGGSVALIKNDRDAVGNIYGAQENYEATLAAGLRLWLWRVALILLLPLAALTWLSLWMIEGFVALYALSATIVYLTGERLLPRPEWLARLLFGCSVKELESDIPTGPAWLEAVLSLVARVVAAPLAITLFSVLWLTAFVRVRKQMTPFLISRAIVCGSGSLDDQGRFHLADKGPAMNCLTGFGGLMGDRPIYCLGHFFKTIYADAWLAPQHYLRLFRQNQRLQISLGDSNLADTAEYLRIGTTLLVLDVIEAGEMPPLPGVRRPIRALRTICGEAGLTSRVVLAGGRTCTALELQRFYLEACRTFLTRRPGASAEARDVLNRWEAALDGLTDDPQSLVGTLDWPTKQFVLEKAGRGASWEAKKKIDLRYHELTPEGYFQRLKTTGIVVELLDRAEIDHARRNPPAGTPAAVRGRYIREFGGDEEEISANWHAVYLGRGRAAKVIRLDRYRQRPTPAAGLTRRKSPRRKDLGGG